MKLAVFCPNWVGDLVMATPALRALRNHFAGAAITAVLRPYVADVLTGLDLVNDILCHEPKGEVRGRRGWGFARELRRRKFDVAVLFPNSIRCAWWAWVSGARTRVGLARGGRSWLLSPAVPGRPRHVPHAVLDEYLKIVAALGCPTSSRRLELAVTDADVLRLERFWSRHNEPLRSDEPTVCLNPGGAYGASKHWPAEAFAEVARRLVRELGSRVLVLCGPSEREMARAIVSTANTGRIFSLAGTVPSLGLTKAAIKFADLLVTTDSGPRHFAPPFDVPVVTLFGPTHMAWSETYYERSLHLQIELECGPCQQRICPVGHHRCMKDLRPDWVFRAARSQLERYSIQRPAA